MKRSSRWLMGIIALALVLTACTPEASNEAAPTAEMPEQETMKEQANPTQEESESAGLVQTELLPGGTWCADEAYLYFFDEQSATGRMVSLEDGMGVSFSYHLQGDEAQFVLGASDAIENCVIDQEDTGEMTFNWQDGQVEKLAFLSKEGSDTFQFYSNQDLMAMTLAYYTAQYGPQEELMAGAQTNEDGTVSIQLYQALGDHNSTAAWYTVDRYTGQGEDDTGAPVDLSMEQE